VRNGYLEHDYFLKHKIPTELDCAESATPIVCIRPRDNARMKDATTGNGMAYQATKMLSTGIRKGERRLSIQPSGLVPLELRHSLHVSMCCSVFFCRWSQFREYVRFRAGQNLQVMDVCSECHLYNTYSFPFMRFRFFPWLWLDIVSVPAIISFILNNKPSLTLMYSGP